MLPPGYPVMNPLIRSSRNIGDFPGKVGFFTLKQIRILENHTKLKNSKEKSILSFLQGAKTDL